MGTTVYEIINDRITSLLEKGVIPWRKPWTIEDMPKSLNSGKCYRGVNVWMLQGTAMDRGYASSYWVTYKQAQERGAQVRKGEKGTPVVYWNWINKEDEQGNADRFPILKYYTVFNAEQCDGLDYPKPDKTSTPDIPKAQGIFENMPTRPELKAANHAYYSPSLDYIGMPDKDYFPQAEEYYSTLFHEAVHSTGHASRLGRFDHVNHVNFGDEDYSKEELVAELGASYLCGTCSIVNATIDNSASYIASWLRALNDDKKMLVHASAQAQKAVDYILGTTYEVVEQ